MRPYLVLFVAAFLQSCDKPSPKQDRLEAKWSEDGESLAILRNGLEVATFRDSSSALYVELSGFDGYPDAQLSYYKDVKNTDGFESKNIQLSWIQKDGSMKAISYDADSNLAVPYKSPATE